MKKMSRIHKIFSSPKGASALFALASVLLLGSAAGGTRAALLYGQETSPRTVRTAQLGVALAEENAGTKGVRLTELPAGETGEDLLKGMVPAGEKAKPGKRYAERLGVKNSGGAAEYVRVTVYRYWEKTDEAGNPEGKVRTVRPDYIGLGFLTGEAGWILDAEASAKEWETDKTFAERTVLYYTKPLNSGETVWFAEGLTIAPEINAALGEQGLPGEDGGIMFRVKVCVDAVQTHNGADAVLSAWGRKVSMDEAGILSLAETPADRTAGTGDLPADTTAGTDSLPAETPAGGAREGGGE